MIKVNRTLKDYEDILHLPHHVSKKRSPMSIVNRAAQFSPFSAVVGHDKAVKEAARYTDKRKELDEMEKVLIDYQLRELETVTSKAVQVEIEYFKPDDFKPGGEYITKVGIVKKISRHERVLLMGDGFRINIDDIYRISID